MNNRYLEELESRSIYIIREAYYEHRDKLAILWSMGKDSTVLVHLARKAFLGNIPVPVLHIDTTYKFKEIYEFRDTHAKEWGLNLIIIKNNQILNYGMSIRNGRFNCCNALKTDALKQAIQESGFTALAVGIRRDEHAIRAKERYFSGRDSEFKWDYHDQPMELWSEYFTADTLPGTHMRVHPLLHWRETDIWSYIEKERLPVVPLYFSRNGKRFRSIGCSCCCRPVRSLAGSVKAIIKELRDTATAERSGRMQDKEFAMQKLRSLGYM